VDCCPIAPTARSSARLSFGIGFTVAAYYFWKSYGPAVMRVGGE
jgi:hypothetical protein